MKKEKKDCMFQYARNRVGIFGMTGDVEIIEDTDLITRKEADELWDKYYPQVVQDLKNDLRPEMGIWIDCKTTTDYHTDIKHIDYECKVDKNEKIYKEIREYL